MNRLLKIIRKIEGSKVHSNKNEKTSTSTHGVYLYTHMNKDTALDIFNYYNSLLEKAFLKINDTYLFTQEELDIINEKLDPVYDSILHKHFYNEYFFNLDKYFNDFEYTPLKLYIYTTYINNNKIPIRALQNYLNNNPYLEQYVDKLKVDGIMGDKSKERLNTLFQYLYTNELKQQMVYDLNNYCIVEYKNLNNQLYIKGWVNRLNDTLSYIFNDTIIDEINDL